VSHGADSGTPRLAGPVRAQQVAAALEDLVRWTPGATPDGWAPTVQGAVGHVVGIRLLDDSSGTCNGAAVLKVYTAQAAARAARVEATALKKLDGWAGLSTPRLISSGLAGAVPWILMTRLDGVRWVDGRQQHGDAAEIRRIQATGRALRLLHSRPGFGYGGILTDDKPQPSALSAVRARASRALHQYAATGGPPSVRDRTRRWLDRRWSEFAPSSGSALLHNDVNRANLIVDSAGALSGLIDWKRATFGDPIADLAHFAQHLRHDTDDNVDVLLAAYGVDSNARARLKVFEILEALTERAWIAVDRPAGWRNSIDRLDTWLVAGTKEQ